jgi:predicted MFS family arabinose efflux permease
VLGLGYSLVQTPTGRLLRRSAHAEDRPALFAAQFALSHACWLVTYPLAGWLGATARLPTTFVVLAALALVATVAAVALWPAHDPEEVAHVHENLAPDHPHLRGAKAVTGGFRHTHAFVIDRDHGHWPA